VISFILKKKIESKIKGPFQKYYASDGLTFDNKGKLYTSALELNGINIIFQNKTIIPLVANASDMVWPDTMGWDHEGNLLFVSNQLFKFQEGILNFNETNFRIWSVYVDADSYLAASAPKLILF